MANPEKVSFSVIDGGVPDRSPANTRAERVSYGGSGGGGPTMDSETKNYLDAKVDAVRAQNDARFSEVIEGIRGIKDDSIGWKGVWGAVATGFIAVGGLLLAVLSISGDRFDGGMAAGVVLQEARSNSERIEGLIDAAEQRDDDIARIIKSLEAQSAQPQESP